MLDRNQGGVHLFIKEGFVRLTADQMQVVVETCLHPLQSQVRRHQSKPAQQHVAVLADIMRRGKWTPNSTLDFARLEGRLILANGVHRALAQVASGNTIDWVIVIHECANEHAFSELFYSFDTTTRPRTTQQILGVSDLAEKNGLPSRVMQGLWSSVSIIARGFSTSKKDIDPIFDRVKDRRLAACDAWVEPAVLYSKCIAVADSKLKAKLQRGSIMAVALVTIKYQPERALEFWSGLAANDGLRRTDPRAVLLSDLMVRNMGKGMAHQGEIVAANAWNSFYAGVERKILRVHEGSKVVIAGTPFDGSRRGK